MTEWFKAISSIIRYLQLIFLFWLVLYSLPVFAQQKIDSRNEPPQNLSFSHILPQEVEALGYILSINQDAQGFMWFGGANGLARYDGYSIKIFRKVVDDPQSLSHSYINDIYRAKNGNLWVATRDGINLFDPVKNIFHSFRYETSDNLSLGANDVMHMIEDRKGNFWLATRAGLFQFEPSTGEYKAKKFLHELAGLPESENSDDIVWKVVEDAQGNIWLGTHKHGVVLFDPVKDTFTQYSHDKDDPFSISHNDVRELYIDNNNSLWVGTYGSGLNLYDRSLDRFKRYTHNASEKSNIIWDVLEDKDGNIWIGDGSAAHVLDPRTERSSRFSHSKSNVTSPGNFVVNTLFEDSAGDMWLGFFPAGVDVVDKQASSFNNYYHQDSDENSVADGGILSSFEDEKGNLWVGAGYGLNYFNRETNKFTRIVNDPENPDSISANTVLSMIVDSYGSLWVGVWAGGLNRMDAGSNKFKHYMPIEGDETSLYGKEPWRIIEDNKRTIWIASEEGVSRYNREEDNFTRFAPPAELLDGDANLYSRVIYEDSRRNLWIGAIRGLFRLDRSTGKFTRYQHVDGDKTTLSIDFVMSMYEDNKGRLWLGTNGGGLNRFDYESKTFESFSVEDGLPDSVVTGIISDDNGYLWLSTQKGLSRFDVDNKTFQNYDSSNGLPGSLFNRNTPLKTRKGELVFGSSKGLTIFDPNGLRENQYMPPVVITSFQIFNQVVEEHETNSPLDKSIGFSDEIVLQHWQSVFSFEYSALNYRSPNENQYAYMLEGFDSQWNYVGNKRSATYTNLDAGDYVFRVKGSNNEGLWNEKGASIRIKVLPPLWATWWAYSVYFLIFVVFMFWFIHTQRMKVNYEREKVAHERTLVKRLKQVDKLKDEFLANTSHELRTPLNGIIGLAESLLDGVAGQLGDHAKQNLKMIAVSGKRLSSLVDDLLDFSKLKNQSIELNKKTIDLHVLVDIILGTTWPLLGEKSIDLINAVDPNLPPVVADEDRLQQVLHNLVGNAIKFTDEGQIVIDASIENDTATIRVSDTGIGIPDNRLEDIFESFKQVEDSTARSYGGTGLGLAISKHLVELHGGKIWAELAAEKGSIFCFTVPMHQALSDENRNAASDIYENTAPESVADYVEELAEPQNLDSTSTKADMPTVYKILVVDDEPINRKVLGNYLSLTNYEVLEVQSGPEALDLFEKEERIDLVLLDIMMPRMSGYEVCRTLRKNYSQHELPVIFLTARSQVSDLVMGFEAGGNDFITKPVAKEELLARVNTHLQLLDISRTLDRKVVERTREIAEQRQQLINTQKVLEDANKRLNQASITDSLTGLRNRRFINNNIGNDVRHIDRVYKDWMILHKDSAPDESDLIFMLLDVDHFKEINDNYGHRAGDAVLEQLSRVISTTLRDSDYLIRWGGEEFLIVLRYTERDKAAGMAERVLAAVRAHPFDLDNDILVNKTCSIGFATYPFYQETVNDVSWEQVIDAADRALYIAKASGRDCWIGVNALRSKDEKDWPTGGAATLDAMLESERLLISASISRSKIVL